MFEFQQKAIRASEDMALAMRARPTSSSSAPNLPGLGGGAARHAGFDSDARWDTVRRVAMHVRPLILMLGGCNTAFVSPDFSPNV